VKALVCKFMDDLADSPLKCTVIATSNRPAEVDACFRRGGRLEKEIDVLESSEDDRHR
jgi:SpoVK/Ycf46/Vps4 family AAA+-type ATPase